MVKKKGNICIIGKGSIGIRHGKILNKEGYNIFFLRKKNKKQKIKTNYNHRDITKIDQIKKNRIDLFIITNPTSEHIKTLLKIKKKNLNVLVEKPIISSEKELDVIKKLYVKFKMNIFSGYQLRYDSRIIFIKKFILKKIKKIRYSSFKLKTFLPNWHPWENFKSSYASQKKLGGGVLLTCSHEIDLANYFFGEAKSVFCIKTKSKLKTRNVENSVLLIIKHKNNIVTNINLDFSFKNTEERGFEITLDDQEIKCDLKKKELLLLNNFFCKKINTNASLNRDSLFKKQNLSILNKIKRRSKKVKFDDLIATEKIIFAAKKSILSKKFENVN
jgi:predicted dehydrogenase